MKALQKISRRANSLFLWYMTSTLTPQIVKSLVRFYPYSPRLYLSRPRRRRVAETTDDSYVEDTRNIIPERPYKIVRVYGIRVACHRGENAGRDRDVGRECWAGQDYGPSARGRDNYHLR